MNESIRGTSRSRFWAVACFILVPILALAGLIAQQGSLSTIREVRVLERIPLSTLNVAIPGPIRTTGIVEQLPGTRLLESKWTQTPCVWYRAVKEVEKRDSEGNTSWSVVLDETRSTDYLLRDDTGIVQVTRSTNANHVVDRSWRKTRGKERFTEYRIVPDERIYVVGRLESADMRPRILFDGSGEFVPIVSEHPIAGSRASRAVLATMLIILSLFLIAAACTCFAIWFQLHNALAFITIVGILEVLFLLIGGLVMMGSDLAGAQESLEKQEQAAHGIVTDGFAQLNIPFNGSWNDDAAFDAARESEPVGTRIIAIRKDLAARTMRTRSVRDRFPQSFVAWVIGLPPSPEIGTEGDPDTDMQARIQTAVPSFLWPLITISAGAVLSIGCLLIGFRKIKLKRLIENIPTTPTREVEIGITEIKGTIASCENIEPLVGPLTEKPCIWFRYLVQEWRGTGKKRRLVTIEDRKRGQVFLCRDDSGSIPVAASGARVISGRKAQKSRGNRVYSEYSLRPEDPVYVLGSAEIDPATGDSLRVEKDPQGLPYLISNLPEKRLKGRQVVGAFWCFALGMAAIAAFVQGLMLFSGRLAAVDQLIVGLASITVVALVIMVIMYNDLVFLRQRVAWARSNIDVALKKRVDLLPQLAAITRGYMAHENEVQPLIARLRNAWMMQDEKNDTTAESVSASSSATSGLLALRERYPDLKADSLTEELMRGIVSLENEIAARRDGYNAAVERYRSRTHAFPELILAKTFAFRDEGLLSWKTEIRQLAPLEFQAPGHTDHDLGREEESE